MKGKKSISKYPKGGTTKRNELETLIENKWKPGIKPNVKPFVKLTFNPEINAPVSTYNTTPSVSPFQMDYVNANPAKKKIMEKQWVEEKYKKNPAAFNAMEAVQNNVAEPGLQDASLEALDALSLASGVGYLGKKGLQLGAKGLANVLKPKPYSRLTFPKPVVSEYIPSLPNASSIDYNEVIRRNKNLKELWENPESNKLMAWDGTPLKLNHISENPDLINTLDNNKLKYQGLYFNPKKEWAFGKELGYSTQPWHKYTVEDAFSKKPYIADYHGQLQNLRPGANRIGDKLRKHISEGKDVKSFVDRERQLGISKIKNQTQSPEFKAYMSKLKKENPESFKNEVDLIRRNRDFKDLDFIENIYNKGYDSYVSYGGPKIDPSERGLEDAYEIVLFNKPTNLKKEFKKGGVIKDDRGQWAHPGEITEIGSNNITMQGINYPVLGVSDLGDIQMMYPEQDYQFKGNKVTEYPMMQKGGTFITAGGEYHKVYKNADGDIIVNHPKEDKGKWDTINLTDKANAKTVAQGVAATKKWHRENPYEDGGKVGEDFAYDRWRRSLPENLKYEDPNYNLRGYWESLNKPELFNPMEFQTEDDGFYHASSRNPETGEILKGKLHPTLQHSLDEDRKLGYFTKMKNGKIYTDTYSDGGTINNMKKRTLKKYQYSYGGLTVTDLNKYQLGGVSLGNAAKIKPVSGATAQIPGGYGNSKSSASIGNPEASLSDGKSSTGATVGNIAGGVGMVMPVIEGLIPDKSYTDSEGNDLGSRKSIGESTLSSAASGAALGSFAGPVGTLVGGALGAGYGAVTGWMEKNEMEEKQKKANFDIQNKKLYNQMNTNVNWGNAGVNTSNNMMFPNGGMVLNYDDPNANAELELQETFQMPDGTVGNVDGPSHEMGGIAVDLPEGTRIWSDKLKYNGKTFAKHTKPITNKIARLEKEIAKSPNNSEAKENSIALLNQQLDYYFDTQETNKETNEMKRTLRQGGMIKRESWGNNTDWEIIE